MEVAKKGPGKHYRKGLSVSEFFEMFPDGDYISGLI